MTFKKQTNKTSSTKAAGSTGRKVYIIYHFLERFEMDEYRRQGGLDYIRMFVTATTQGKSNESTEFFQQLKELRFYYPDKYYSFFGIFWTLASLTATREDWLRGYLLDGNLQPLSENKLTARLQISLKETRAALLALKRVGLLEYKPCPEFNKPEREKEKSGSQKYTKYKQPGKQKSDTGTSKKAAIREHSEIFGNVSELLNNKNKNKIELKENQIKKEKELKKEIEIESEGEAQQKKNIEGTNKNNDMGNSTESSIPTNLTKTDAPGQAQGSNARPSRTPDKPKEHIGYTIDFMKHKYDQPSMKFAVEVMEKMGLLNGYELQRLRDGCLQLTAEQAAERGCWASAWYQASNEFGPDSMAKLRAEIFKRIPLALKNGKEPSAYLRTAWNNLVKDIRRKKQPARASPVR